MFDLPEDEYRALIEKSAKESGEMQLKTMVEAGYQRGLDAALKALPEGKVEPSIRSIMSEVNREEGYNQAIAEARSNIEKLKEPSND